MTLNKINKYTKTICKTIRVYSRKKLKIIIITQRLHEILCEAIAHLNILMTFFSLKVLHRKRIRTGRAKLYKHTFSLLIN